jgi:hypothetical protein
VGSKADGSQFIAELLRHFKNKYQICVVIADGGSVTLEKYLEESSANDRAEQLPGIFDKIIRGNICTRHI